MAFAVTSGWDETESGLLLSLAIVAALLFIILLALLIMLIIVRCRAMLRFRRKQRHSGSYYPQHRWFVGAYHTLIIIMIIIITVNLYSAFL